MAALLFSQLRPLPNTLVIAGQFKYHSCRGSQIRQQAQTERGGDIAIQGGGGHLTAIEMRSLGENRNAEKSCASEDIVATAYGGFGHKRRQLDAVSAILL